MTSEKLKDTDFEKEIMEQRLLKVLVTTFFQYKPVLSLLYVGSQHDVTRICC